MPAFKFKAVKYVDPKTKEIIIISPEEQEAMLEKGIRIDFPVEPVDNSQK